MMRRLGITFDLFVLAVMGLVVAATLWQLWQWAAPEVQYWNGDAPPMEYRGPATAIVAFTTPEEVSRVCGKDDPPPPGLQIVACSWPGKFAEGVVIMPDPCAWADTEYYAKIQCHENAHLRGWVHD